MTEVAQGLEQEAAPEGTTIVTGDGRIAIPAAIREALGMEEGDEIVLAVDRTRPGVATLRRRSAVDRTFGVVPGCGRPLTIKEMHEAVAEGMVARAMQDREEPDRSGEDG